MQKIEKLFHRSSHALLPALCLFGTALGTVAAAQDPPACGTVQYVGIEADKPFTAEYVTSSLTHSVDGTEGVRESRELVARDSAGRIRFERSSSAQPTRDKEPVILHTRDGGTIETTQGELHILTMVFDFPDGKSIRIQPGMRIANTSEERKCTASSAPVRLYSQFSKSLTYGKQPPTTSFEELGSKEMEGLVVQGFRTTQREVESRDEKKNERKAWTGISEVWVSDELAVTVLDVKSDLDGKDESRSRMIHIKRGEPDSSLFEIPAGYRVNPGPSEMPYQTDRNP